MTVLPTNSLRGLNTLGVDARAGRVVSIDDAADPAQIEFDPGRDLVLGDGSNVLLADDVDGTVYLVRLKGRRMLPSGDGHALVEAAAGENWHALVRWSLDQGLCGLENLSLIPGRVGAAPLQNIGAYGVELADRLLSLRAWDWERGEAVELQRDECAFAYRDSRFKSREPGRYLILSLRLRLDRQFRPQLAYPGLRAELEDRGVSKPTARDVSDAVIALRRRKLPDPAQTGNAGSFFKNPQLGTADAERLRSRYPDLPLYAIEHGAAEAGAKASAAWMIERCGWKGHREGDAGVSERHALVLVNYGGASGRELLALARRIRRSVHERFGVELEYEPRIIGSGNESQNRSEKGHRAAESPP